MKSASSLSVQSLGPELSKRDAAIARLQQALRDKEEQVGQQDQQLLDLSTRKAAEVGVLEKALADLRGVVEQQGGEGEGGGRGRAREWCGRKGEGKESEEGEGGKEEGREEGEEGREGVYGDTHRASNVALAIKIRIFWPRR